MSDFWSYHLIPYIRPFLHSKKNFFLISQPKHVVSTQKNHLDLNETVVFSTQNICLHAQCCRLTIVGGTNSDDFPGQHYNTLYHCIVTSLDSIIGCISFPDISPIKSDGYMVVNLLFCTKLLISKIK